VNIIKSLKWIDIFYSDKIIFTASKGKKGMTKNTSLQDLRIYDTIYQYVDNLKQIYLKI